MPRKTAIAAACAGLALLSGCSTFTPPSENVRVLTGPSPYINRTPMHAALVCQRRTVTTVPDVRFGVADFIDASGATPGGGDINAKYFSQRPDLMLIVALSRAGVHLVNRSSTGVAEWEQKQAMERKLGDGKPTMVGNTKFDYRPVRAGEFLGSNYYINGAITELNWNIYTDTKEFGAFGVTAGHRTYRIAMAVDLVVSNSLTTEIVFARSYSKQVVGYEVGAGVFRFVNAALLPQSAVELFQANLGQKENEPVQAALRWLIETAAYDVVTGVYGRSPNCDALVPGGVMADHEDDAPPVAARYPVATPIVPAPQAVNDTRPVRLNRDPAQRVRQGRQETPAQSPASQAPGQPAAARPAAAVGAPAPEASAPQVAVPAVQPVRAQPLASAPPSPSDESELGDPESAAAPPPQAPPQRGTALEPARPLPVARRGQVAEGMVATVVSGETGYAEDIVQAAPNLSAADIGSVVAPPSACSGVKAAVLSFMFGGSASCGPSVVWRRVVIDGGFAG